MQLNAKFLVEQLRQRIATEAAIAARAGSTARDAAQHSTTAMEKREDGRVMIEFGNLAFAHGKRVAQAQQALQTLDTFAANELPSFGPRTPIALGAIVEAQGEDDSGEYSRTFVLLPAGAGEELTGPGGDGAIVVITPASPIGRAMMGKRVGDVVETMVNGEPMDWAILEVM